MRSDQNEIEIFKQMAVKVAAHFQIADVQCWDDLPGPFRELIQNIEYKSLIVPLVCCDRKCGQTWQQLSIKYRVSIQTIRTILGRCSLMNNAPTRG